MVGTKYTLNVDVGTRKDQPGTGVVQLLVGTTPITAVGVAPTPGNFSTFTATYTGVAADAGKSLAILLSATSSQGDFDNVRMDATPEPASAFLLGLGLAGVSLLTRRKRTA